MKQAQTYVNGRFLTQPVTGVNRYAYDECRAMRDVGEAFVLICPRGRLNDAYDLSGMQVRRFGFGRSHFWAQLVLPWFFLFRRQSRLLCFIGLAPLLVKHTLMTIHDLSFLHNPAWYSRAYYLFYKRMTPVCARHAEVIRTVSQTSKEDILRHYPFLNGKPIEVIPPRVNTAFFRPADKRRQPFVLAVSSLDPRKNLRKLVEAVSTDASVRLLIVGGSWRVFGDANMTEAPNVEMLGRVSDEALRDLYQTAAGLVYPSLFEGYGIPPVEALSCGCPVAVSDIPVLHETCDPLLAGGARVVYFDPLDEQDMLLKIKSLLAEIE
jgi:glycosyltransferase involved in cell wall biosynthesis